MKTYTYLLSALLLLGGATACSDDWDDHYARHEMQLNNVEMVVTGESMMAYLASDPNYSAVNSLFEATGVAEQLGVSNKPHTMFVVANDDYVAPQGNRAEGESGIDPNLLFQAQSLVTDVSLAPANAADGMRLKMLNGRFVDVAIAPLVEGGGDVLTIGKQTINKVIKTANGYIYELKGMIEIPRSLMEIVENLGDDYSMFRDTILARTGKVFNRALSTPIGVDNSGNTIYDSVFDRRNPYFEVYGGINIVDENAKLTMFIPSNAQIEKALADAYAKLEAWGQREDRPDSVLHDWVIFKSMFYDKAYQPEDIETVMNDEQGNVDLTSAFGKQWRTTVNKVDLSRPVTMTNGMAYYVTDLKIPNKDVLIWRYKEMFDYCYRVPQLSQADIDSHYSFDNLFVHSAISKGDGYSYGHAGWPWYGRTYSGMRFYVTDGTLGYASFTFVPCRVDGNEDNTYTIEDWIIPSGEYTFHFGFSSSWKKLPAGLRGEFYINDELIADVNTSTFQGFTRDRGGGGSPEFWDDFGTGDTKYHRDGPEVAVVTIKNDELKPLKIMVKEVGSSLPTMWAGHWCLRPTKNNY